jgi:hypothetical protein
MRYVKSNRRTLRYLRCTMRKVGEYAKGAIFLLFLPFF